MGGRLARGASRQHPNLTAPISAPDAPTTRWMRPVVLVFLILDGVLSAVAGALFLPLYVGVVPMPVSAVLSGVVNAALVWAAVQWTSNRTLAAGPLWAFAGTVVLLTFGGPGGDTVFAGTTAGLLRLLLLLGIGLIPAALVLRRYV